MKLLIVDDETKLLSLLKEHLSNEFTIETSSEVQTAFDILQDYVPDGIIVDWNMPDGGGQLFIETLRDKEEYDYIPILVLTAYDTLIVHNRAIEAGADGYLAKPASLEQIKTIVLDLINKQMDAKKVLQNLSS
ncbi:MAG: response regulator [Candidatus Cloacimonetes bacterium]|nr:response regulator [Candidatus Cloacimonadota bacterium]